jgi:sulfotransferase family protein
MPSIKKSIAIKVARGLNAYLKLEAGLTRRGLEELRDSPPPVASAAAARNGGGRANGAHRIKPERIVWIFGSGRSGSTWLSSMMGDIEGHALWGEPWVGALFGRFYYRSVDRRRHDAPHFIMGPHKEAWLGAIRNFVLDSAEAVFPALSAEGYLVIKESNGSVGAPLMMGAFPESRMVLLVRDPRDVVASYMDASRKGGWHYERNKERYSSRSRIVADTNPLRFAEERARRYLRGMGKAKEAYDAHQGHKVLVKYEDLRVDTLKAMKCLYATLEIPVDERELARVVERHSWENIPEGKKGEGKFRRKAQPGAWREDLTPEQAEVVERITTPLLEELYPASKTG